MELAGKNVLVVGLGASGVGAARLCRQLGARVTVTDRRPLPEVGDRARALEPLDVRLCLGAHDESDFLGADLIVKSPGVPPELEPLAKARKRGVPIIGEIELAARCIRRPIVGITGTNGKSTTTSLIGDLVRASGLRPFVGGNLGRPLSECALDPDAYDIVVCELSSFQLEDADSLRPKVAVLLNVTPDHLDRHASVQAYERAKARIFARQGSDDFAVVNGDDPGAWRLSEGIAARRIAFGRCAEWPVRDEGAAIACDVGGGVERYRVDVPSLRGAHNRENAMAAIAAARLAGVTADAVQAGLDRFRGLEHRLERVRVLDGVEYVNDSKATNVDAAEKALAAFDAPIVWIAGGRGKGAPYAPLRPLVEGRVKVMLLVGEDGERIARELEGAAPASAVGTVERAVEEARWRASPGDVVLLSPACASYDQFHDYAERGQVFKRCVRAL